MDFAKDAGHLMGRLHGLSARTDAAERKILDAALARDAAARQRMEELRPQVLTVPGASREYQMLALELRRLALVIQMARTHAGAMDGADGGS